MSIGIGIPIKVLQEAEGRTITCEAFSGEKYEGKLVEAEDNMNCQMTGVTATFPDGKTASIENIYVRGSKIKCLILPDSLKNSSLFKRQPAGGRGRGGFSRGQAGGRGRGRGNPSWGNPGGSSGYGSRGGRRGY